MASMWWRSGLPSLWGGEILCRPLILVKPAIRYAYRSRERLAGLDFPESHRDLGLRLEPVLQRITVREAALLGPVIRCERDHLVPFLGVQRCVLRGSGPAAGRFATDGEFLRLRVFRLRALGTRLRAIHGGPHDLIARFRRTVLESLSPDLARVAWSPGSVFIGGPPSPVRPAERGRDARRRN